MHEVGVRWARLAVLAAAMLSGVAAAVVLVAKSHEPQVLVEGHVPPTAEPLKTWLQARATRAEAATLTLQAADSELTRMRSALGLRVDVAATARAVDDARQRSGLFAHVWRRVRVVTDVPWVWTLDEELARQALTSWSSQVEVPAVSARISLEERRKVPEVTGLSLNVDGTLSQLRAFSGEEHLVAAVVRVAPEVTAASLPEVDVERVVAAFETKFSRLGSGAFRAKNIRQAASRLDGVILGVGEEFSFNHRVGPRTEERGFVYAPEILRDEMEMGVGGGVCQVSSTLHAAALFAALEVTERHSHSRPSSYTKLGLDATVVYPTADLKLRNALPYPVMIHAYLRDAHHLRIEVLGGDAQAQVDYGVAVDRVQPFYRRIRVVPELRPGKVVRHQKGNRGIDVRSIVRLDYLDGRSRTVTYKSEYQPAPEVFFVQSEADMTQLPPPREGVEFVEMVTGHESPNFHRKLMITPG